MWVFLGCHVESDPIVRVLCARVCVCTPTMQWAPAQVCRPPWTPGGGRLAPPLHLGGCTAPSAGRARAQQQRLADQVPALSPRSAGWWGKRGGQSLVDPGPSTFHPGTSHFTPGTSRGPCPLVKRWRLLGQVAGDSVRRALDVGVWCVGSGGGICL